MPFLFSYINRRSIVTESIRLQGWWVTAVGPDQAIDTNKYFVICANVIGGCMGSLGPRNINPETNKPYGLDFPVITIKDMVRAQESLLEHLGIRKLLCATGGSMGGMQLLQFCATFPDKAFSAIPIAVVQAIVLRILH